MRFIIDENAPLALVRLLEAPGHDAIHVARIDPRTSDARVLVAQLVLLLDSGNVVPGAQSVVIEADGKVRQLPLSRTDHG